uniref:Uncharacterized protein n=1 Tax=Parascaris univalens TaxID=6257 RepID=A0A915CA76_PARUN
EQLLLRGAARTAFDSCSAFYWSVKCLRWLLSPHIAEGFHLTITFRKMPQTHTNESGTTQHVPHGTRTADAHHDEPPNKKRNLRQMATVARKIISTPKAPAALGPYR